MPTDAEHERMEPVAGEHDNTGHDHAPSPGLCPRCQILRRGSPSWKTWLQQQHDPGPADLTAPAASLPPLEFKALRLLPFGWGEGWQLRPSPPRRHWMDELPHSYKCLPLVMANQWGWQILCPTDVVVTWDGSTSLTGLDSRSRPVYTGDQEPVRRRDRHVLTSMAVSHPARLESISQGTEQPLET